LLAKKEDDSSLLNPLLPRENAANPFLIPFFLKPCGHQELKWDHSFGHMLIPGCLITSMCPESITL